ncbi:hypothetical protein [Streptomyces sp. NPDC001415]
MLLLAVCALVLSGCEELGEPLPVKQVPAPGSAAPAHGCRLNRGGWVELPCVPDQDANHRHTRGSCARGRPGPHRCRRH